MFYLAPSKTLGEAKLEDSLEILEHAELNAELQEKTDKITSYPIILPVIVETFEIYVCSSHTCQIVSVFTSQ